MAVMANDYLFKAEVLKKLSTASEVLLEKQSMEENPPDMMNGT